MFKKNQPNIEVPDQSFVKDVNVAISSSHPLKIRKLARPAAYFFLGALFIVGGVVGITMPYEGNAQLSANIVAACIFFGFGLFFIALMFLTYKATVVIKEVKSTVIGVWVGLRKNIIYVDSRRVYKGKDDVVDVFAGNRKITVNIVGKIVYFE